MAWSGLTVIFVIGNPAKFPTYLFIRTNYLCDISLGKN